MRTPSLVVPPPRAAYRVVVAAVPLVMGAAPSVDEIALEAAKTFDLLDVAPRDGVLTGREREAFVAYDADVDGRVTREEFARGFVVKKPVAWQRHEFEQERFSCEMPVPPRPLAVNAGAMRFQVVADVPEPRVVLVARSRDITPRLAGKPAAFFDIIAGELQQRGARIVARSPADCGLQRGEVVEIEWGDGRVEIVRAVIRGQQVYELDAIVAPGVGPPGRVMAERFLGSLQFMR